MNDREPVELVKLEMPVLLEAVCVAIGIGCLMALLIIYATPGVPV